MTNAKTTAAKKPATTRSKTPAATAKKPASTKIAATTKVTTKAAATKKLTAPRTTATKPAVKTAPKAAAAPSRAKAGAVRVTLPKPTPAQRHRMIEQAAYFLAEKNSFSGQSMEYWVAAEAQIDAMLSGARR